MIVHETDDSGGENGTSSTSVNRTRDRMAARETFERYRRHQKTGLVSERIEMFNKQQAPLPPPPPQSSNQTVHSKKYTRRIDSFATTKQNRAEPKECRDEVTTTPKQNEDQFLPHDYVGCSLVRDGVQEYQAGEYDKALKAFSTALKTQLVSVGEEDLCIALTMGNLGITYLQKGNVDEAEKAFKDVLFMKRKLAPDMIVADILSNLGTCASLRQDYKVSLDYHKEALDDLYQKHGPPQAFADALYNIGRVEIQLSQWVNALGTLSEAWRNTKEVYGVNHVFVAQTLELLGFAQLQLKDTKSAMVSYTSSLVIYRKIHGSKHLSVADTLYNIGMVRERCGLLTDAYEAFAASQELYSILATPNDDPGLCIVRDSIAMLEKKIAKENQAHLVAKHREAKERHGVSAGVKTTV